MTEVKTIDVLEVCAAIAALPGLRFLNVVHGRELALTLHGPRDVEQQRHELAAIRGGNVFLFFVLLVPEGQSDAVLHLLPAVPGGWLSSPTTMAEPCIVQYLSTFDVG